MAGERLSNGVAIAVETAAGPPIVYTDIGGIQEFQAPARSRNEIEVTALDSTGLEYIADLIETEETSFTLFLRREGTTNLFTAGQERLQSLSASGDIVSFRVTYPTSFGTRTITCNGFVKRWAPTFGTRQAATAEVTIKWTGAPTYV